MPADVNDCPLCRKVSGLEPWLKDELIWEFPNSVLTLGPWQYYQGYSILVARRHFVELFEATSQERADLIEELTLAAQAIYQVVHPRKLNYEWLGNQVPHMHWHLFPRQEDDPDKLKAVWVALEAAHRDSGQAARQRAETLDRAELVRRLQEAIRPLAGR